MTDREDAITSLIAKWRKESTLYSNSMFDELESVLASLIGGRPRCSNDEHVFASPASRGLCDCGSWLIAVAVAQPRTADSKE